MKTKNRINALGCYASTTGKPSKCATAKDPGPFMQMSSKDFRDLQAAPKKTNKHNAKSTVIDGRRFDSKWEAQRYIELQWLLKANKISNLECQVKFPLAINGLHICNYIADFVYIRDGKSVIEDAKGNKTRIFIIKSRMMKAIYDIDVVEVYRDK